MNDLKKDDEQRKVVVKTDYVKPKPRRRQQGESESSGGSRQGNAGHQEEQGSDGRR